MNLRTRRRITAVIYAISVIGVGLIVAGAVADHQPILVAGLIVTAASMIGVLNT